MKPWDMPVLLVLLLAMPYMACQGNSKNESSGNAPEGEAWMAVSEGDEADPPSKTQDPSLQETGAAEDPERASKEEAPKARQEEVVFAENAFPPTVSDTDYHKGAWYKDDCLRCHETGVGDATRVDHRDLPPILLKAKCRSCHVLIPGQDPIKRKKTADDSLFAMNAFPPMIPASDSHREAWLDDNCLLCHESGVRGAPVVQHRDMPKVLLKAKCRSCHVQIRSPSVPGR